jgi:hypothetical protein
VTFYEVADHAAARATLFLLEALKIRQPGTRPGIGPSPMVELLPTEWQFVQQKDKHWRIPERKRADQVHDNDKHDKKKQGCKRSPKPTAEARGKTAHVGILSGQA